jgi:hypothetical protein
MDVTAAMSLTMGDPLRVSLRVVTLYITVGLHIPARIDQWNQSNKNTSDYCGNDKV